MSKGSRPRPFSVSQETFGQNLENIFGAKPKKESYVPPPLPDDFYKEEKQANIWQTDNNKNESV
jgi:hypothetical protein